MTKGGPCRPRAPFLQVSEALLWRCNESIEGSGFPRAWLTAPYTSSHRKR